MKLRKLSPGQIVIAVWAAAIIAAFACAWSARGETLPVDVSPVTDRISAVEAEGNRRDAELVELSGQIKALEARLAALEVQPPVNPPDGTDADGGATEPVVPAIEAPAQVRADEPVTIRVTNGGPIVVRWIEGVGDGERFVRNVVNIADPPADWSVTLEPAGREGRFKIEGGPGGEPFTSVLVRGGVSAAPVPPVDGSDAGFSAFPLHPEARAIYVAANGDNANDGLSRDRPKASPRGGLSAVRDGAGDHLLLRAGDMWVGKTLGDLNKSGRSAEHPLVIGVYGDGPRPVMDLTDDSWISNSFNNTVRHVVIQGIRITSSARNPDAPGWTQDRLNEKSWRLAAIGFLGPDRDIRIEDCMIDNMHFALVFQSIAGMGPIRDITIRRNIIRHCYGHWNPSIAKDSSGLYIDNHDGLTLTENLFDHNGWREGVRGAKPTARNHNAYVQYDGTANNVIRGNVFARGSSHGIQVRAGGTVENNLFLENALAFFVGTGPSRVVDNVVLGGRDIDDDNPRGFGFEVQPVPECLVRNNIVSQKRTGAAGWAHAIKLDGSDDTYRRMQALYPGSRWSTSFEGNKVYDWPREHGPTVWRDAKGIDSSVTGWDTTAIDAADWVDPGRDVERYMETLGLTPSVDAYLDRLAERPRGVWHDDLSAAAVNGYVREGFETR